MSRRPLPDTVIGEPGGTSEESTTGDRPAGFFGAELEPVLRDACQNRLSPIRWFRTDWQRGGALTGNATWDGPQGPVDVVVKLPVPPLELAWLRQLQDGPDPILAPILHDHGTTLRGYDMAWVVMERLPHGPIGSKWDGAEFDLLTEAAVRFYAVSATSSPAWEGSGDANWAEILDTARRCLKPHQIPSSQRWQRALRQADRRLKGWLEIWSTRPRREWCHGDLHFANVMTRRPPPEGPGVLIDFARARPGHWVEDTVYFEHLFWSRRAALGGRKPCSLVARRRKQTGLPVDENWPQLASIRRAMLALTTPLTLSVHGQPGHIEAALEVLEAAPA